MSRRTRYDAMPKVQLPSKKRRRTSAAAVAKTNTVSSSTYVKPFKEGAKEVVPPTGAQKRRHRSADADATPSSWLGSSASSGGTLHVPLAIFKTVGFRRRGKKKLSLGKRKAFENVCTAFVVPPDLETSNEFGPHGGSSFEERVLAAYASNLLKPKGNVESDASVESRVVAVCLTCGDVGHTAFDCPNPYAQ